MIGGLMEGGGSFQKICYDTELMRSSAAEGMRLSSQISEEIHILQEQDQDESLYRLLAVCRGYEILLRNLEAAANIYSLAAEAAEDLT